MLWKKTTVCSVKNITYSLTDKSSILISDDEIIIGEKNSVKSLKPTTGTVNINGGFFVLNKGNKLVRLLKYQDQYVTSEYLEIDYDINETFTDITQLVVDKNNSVLFIDNGVLKGIKYQLDYEFA